MIRLLMSVGRYHQEVPDAVDQLGLRSWPAVLRYPADLLLGHAVAAVLGAVQVQGGLSSSSSSRAAPAHQFPVIARRRAPVAVARSVQMRSGARLSHQVS